MISRFEIANFARLVYDGAGSVVGVADDIKTIDIIITRSLINFTSSTLAYNFA
jgi:hypothetical protein